MAAGQAAASGREEAASVRFTAVRSTRGESKEKVRAGRLTRKEGTGGCSRHDAGQDRCLAKRWR